MSEQGDDEGFRIEHDSMGEVRVPRDAKWRAQTQRAVENFPISGHTDRAGPDRGAGSHQGAARAVVNAELGVLDARRRRGDPRRGRRGRARRLGRPLPDRRVPDRLGHVEQHERQRGHRHARHRPARARRAPQRPRERVAVVQRRVPVGDPHRRDQRRRPRPGPGAASTSRQSLRRKAQEFATVVKSGRTHLMDATPVTLGQEFGGYAAQVRLGVERLQASLPRLAELPLGGTAVGTGINTPPGFSARVIAELAEHTGLPLTEARDHFEAQGARDGAGRAVRPAAHRSPSRSTRSPTTSAGWARARAPAWPRSACPTCSRARRSCPARSTR